MNPRCSETLKGNYLPFTRNSFEPDLIEGCFEDLIAANIYVQLWAYKKQIIKGSAK